MAAAQHGDDGHDARWQVTWRPAPIGGQAGDDVHGAGYWNTFQKVYVEVINARRVRFKHKDLQVIVRSPMADRILDAFAVELGHMGALFEDGSYVETLPPGLHAFWKNMAKVMLVPVSLTRMMP
jgi:hypothetical protein